MSSIICSFFVCELQLIVLGLSELFQSLEILCLECAVLCGGKRAHREARVVSHGCVLAADGCRPQSHAWRGSLCSAGAVCAVRTLCPFHPRPRGPDES